MKKLTALLLALLMVCSIVLTSCATTPESTEAPSADSTEKATTEDKETNKSTEPDDKPDTTPYNYAVPFVDEAVFSSLTKAFEEKKTGGTPYYLAGAPYVLQDLQAFENSKLVEISIPVIQTLAKDADGNFVFTLSVFKNDFASLGSSTPTAYKINISAEKYGLEPNKENIYKMITVDLTEYDIVLGDNETIGVASASDTLVPAYLADNNQTMQNPLFKIAMQEAPQLIGFTLGAGRQTVAFQTNALLYNFKNERTFIGKEAYDAEVNKVNSFYDMVDAVAEVYGGKQLSIMGDSISTYKDISNNTEYNSTIGKNAVWYGDGAIKNAKLWDHEYTYWGSLIRNTGMELCVNNSWSGDSLCGGKAFGRATNLHNNEGTNPDLILTYYGINDTWGTGRDCSNLPELLKAKGDKTNKEVVAEWFEGVLAKAEEKDFADGWGQSYSGWDEAYALMLYKMTEKYADAKIVCITLTHNGAKVNYASADERVPVYDECIKAIAEYFDALVVEQRNVIDAENYASYMHSGDKDGKPNDANERFIHPNAHGHKVLFEEIIRTLYADIQNNA